MPPAFNLSQDQTLQFNLCFVTLLSVSFETSLTQNTDRPVPKNSPILLLCEHLINLKFPIRFTSNRRTPPSAHTYRLLIFKEPCPACVASFLLRFASNK